MEHAKGRVYSCHVCGKDSYLDDATPDLLDAVRGLLIEVQRLMPDHQRYDSTFDNLYAVQCARKAIAKAEGEQS